MTLSASTLPDLESWGVRARVLDVDACDGVADLALLSEAERLRAERFRAPRDRSSYVAGRAALRRELADELGIAAHRVPITPGRHGRPELPGELAGALDFNVSHSATAVAVAVARGRRIGIDVESVYIERDIELLIQEVMGATERDHLARLSGTDHLMAFYECWTRKEAIVKAMGVGLGYPVRELDFPAVPANGRVTVRAHDERDARSESWMVRTVHLSEEFVLSLAFAEHGTMSAPIRNLDRRSALSSRTE
jgi:4'-phosphopantetheinyl transferase